MLIDAIAPSLDKIIGEQAHEASKTDEFDTGSAQLRVGRRGERLLIAISDYHTRQVRRCGMREPRRGAAVADDHGDFGRIGRIAAGFDQRLQI